MSKVRVSFVLDTSSLGLAHDVQEGVAEALMRAARAYHVEAQKVVRGDARLAPEDKTMANAVAVRGMMLALMAEANLTVEPMPEDTRVSTDMAFGGSATIS